MFPFFCLKSKCKKVKFNQLNLHFQDLIQNHMCRGQTLDYTYPIWGMVINPLIGVYHTVWIPIACVIPYCRYLQRILLNHQIYWFPIKTPFSRLKSVKSHQSTWFYGLNPMKSAHFGWFTVKRPPIRRSPLSQGFNAGTWLRIRISWGDL